MTVASNICTTLHNGTPEIPDPGSSGNITVDRSPCVVNIVTAGAETRTLKRPTKSGVLVTLYARTISTSCTITPTGGFDVLGSTTIVFTAAGQYAMLQSVETATAGTFTWRLISSNALGDLTGLLATAAEINRATDLSTRIVDCTAASLALTLALHDGKTVTLNKATGIAITLPAATGTGARFRLIVGTTVTTTDTITITRAGSDTIFGQIYQLADGGSTLAAYELPGSTVITLGTSSNTTGGTKGDSIELEDIASATWWCVGHTTAAGTEATPVT